MFLRVRVLAPLAISMSWARIGERARTDSCTWKTGQFAPLSGPSWTMKMEVVKLLKFAEGVVSWVVVEERNNNRTYVNSPTSEAPLYEARGAARD